jgi:hypothetical protein
VSAFDFHLGERLKHFVEGRKILEIARFVSRREHNVRDFLGQLNVSNAFPPGIRFGGRIFVTKYGWPSPVFPTKATAKKKSRFHGVRTV